MALPFPYEFKELEPHEKSLVEANQFCRVGPKGYLVLKPFMKDAANIYNMPLRASDVIVASYQRSGTTMTQELVWLVANDLDYARAEAEVLVKRYPFLDGFMFFDESTVDQHVEIITKDNPYTDKQMMKDLLLKLSMPRSSNLAMLPSPRFIKTHFPMSLLPPTCLDTAKVVYIARDPRDVAVSSYHHSLLFRLLQYPGGFKEFWNLFTRDLFTLTPYFEHVKEAWDLRNNPNMLFLFYEDVTKDMLATIKRVADFLGKELNEEQVAGLCEHLSIDKFKNNKSVNMEDWREIGMMAPNEKFIRKGKAGGWRAYFDEEMTQQAERWIADNLRDTDLRFLHMEH